MCDLLVGSCGFSWVLIILSGFIYFVWLWYRIKFL